MAAEPKPPTPKPLALKAYDAEDLAVLSACLQDAIIRRADLVYDPKGRRFALIASRLCRESGTAGPPTRARSIVRFDGVSRVQSRGLERILPSSFVSLLTIDVRADDPERPGELHLVFAGDAGVRLTIEAIDVTLKDEGPHWRGRIAPDHGLDKV